MAQIHTAERKSGVRYEVRWTDGNGSSRSKTFRRKKDAEAKVKEIHGQRYGYVEPERVRFEKWAEQWVATEEGRLAPKTIQSYRSLLDNWIVPLLGSKMLHQITPAMLREWMASIQRPAPGVKTASPATAAAARRCLHRCLEIAVATELIDRNPCTVAVHAPRVQAHTVEPLTAEEVVRLEGLMPERWSALVLVAGTGGARFAELAALTRSDVSADGRRLEITKTLHTRAGGGQEVRGPKTQAGMRIVGLPPIAADALRAHLARSDGERVWPGLVSNASRWRMTVWQPAVAAIGHPGYHFHDLRHTAISLAIGSGADAKVVQHMVGHASLLMTLGRYGHVLNESVATVTEAMQRKFDQPASASGSD